MHIHILGICGTFMAGVAVLAKQQGHQVSGSDQQVYPPMSSQLQEQEIRLQEGYLPEHLQPAPDCVVIGNAMKRGNPAVEYLLNEALPYTSGPQWLAENILAQRTVLAVSGTHGKTTTASMLAWILEYAQLAPGFLIGGIPNNFGVSARLGQTPFFVIEADEYDSAFFDKRSKFIHYRPKVLIINNIEYDHADIFPNLAAIQQQFHHLVRTIPGNGTIIYPAADAAIQTVLAQGCWSKIVTTGDQAGWQAEALSADGSKFIVSYQGQTQGRVEWSLLGQHNMANALSAIAAAQQVGVEPAVAIAALAAFKGVKRRLEIKGRVHDITVYDDFAHHPTAIASTLQGLRAKVGQRRIIAVLELASNTMRSGVHQDTLAPALQAADYVLLAKPKTDSWDIQQLARQITVPTVVGEDAGQIINTLLQYLQPHDHILIMSNSGFEGIHQRLLSALQTLTPAPTGSYA